MSSKSRKQSQSPRRPGSARPRSKPDASFGGDEPPQGEHHGVFDIPDEVLHAPKETSKLRFALMILLVVFLLVIFTVGDALWSIGQRSGGRDGDGTYLTWDRPGVGVENVTYNEFQLFHSGIEDARRVDPFLSAIFGLEFGQRTLDPRDAARVWVLDRLARDAGIRVGDDALAEHLRLVLQFVYRGDREALRASFASYRSDVEETLRMGLRVQHYLQLLGFAGAVPLPADIEEAWNAEHAEVRLEYVFAEVADFEDAARAELPSDEELQAWFDEKPDWERAALNDPERRGAQVAVFRSASATPAAGLVEAFPSTAEGDAEERALEYYNQVFTRRFVELPDPGEEVEEGTTGARFRGFDEVREACLVEEPVWTALQAWLADLSARAEAGEEIDFVAEAGRYGLELVGTEPLTRVDLLEHPELGDTATAAAVFATAPGSFAATPAVTQDLLGVVRVTERVEAALPPFAEIRDEVADLWVEPRAIELATESLRSLWQGFDDLASEEEEAGAPRRVRKTADADAFRAAVEEAGYALATKDWFDRGARSKPDPDAAPADVFLQRNPQLTTLDVDEVGEPLPGNARERVYLVRMAGERPIPLARMSPRDYERYVNQARNAAQASLRDVELDYFEELYGLDLPGYREEAADEDEEDGGEEPEAAPAE